MVNIFSYNYMLGLYVLKTNEYKSTLLMHPNPGVKCETYITLNI